MGQTKARCAANGGSIGKCRNAGMARVQWFPAGESPGGHLLRCALLQWNNHCGKERALHMTTGRLAVAGLCVKGRATHMHIPVLLDAFVEALCINPDGCYVDATFGRGGHAKALLTRLSGKGRLLALDRDPQAIAEGERLAAADVRFCIRHRPFSDLGAVLDDVGWDAIHGIGFDLGVSSPQLDHASRGFSFGKDGPLDMRMDTSSGRTLAQCLERMGERELVHILREYGDERYAGRIARAIIRMRDKGALMRTTDLENVCFHAVPRQARYGNTHPATRTFQALRIWVNDEMGQLETGVREAMGRLAPGGRLAVISFHSGEDRRVRDLIEAQVHPCACPPEFPVCVCGKVPTMRWVQKKPLRASEDECNRNPRSRTARLRIAGKLQ